MKRAFIGIFGLLVVLASCTERMICPAYQSAYIYDKDELRKKFSYFIDDSTPKVYTASKNKYLIAEPMSYSKKIRSMQTVKMKPVPVHVPDSISGKGKVEDSISMDEMRRATQSVQDSTFIVDRPKKDSVAKEPLDSIYVISKDKEVRLLVYNGPDSLDYDSVQQKYVRQKAKYSIRDVRVNLDEENYLWYLRDEIVLPDVRLAKKLQEEGGEGGSKRKEKRGLKGLFKKKEKEAPADTTSNIAPEEEEFDYVDEADSTLQAETPLPGQQQEIKPAKEKKGLFGRKKKEKAPKKSDAKKPEDEQQPKKKENEDDGF